MVKKSKLLLALDAHKGRDYEAEKQKKLIKAAEKRKAKKKAKLEAEKREKEGKDEVRRSAFNFRGELLVLQSNLTDWFLLFRRPTSSQTSKFPKMTRKRTRRRRSARTLRRRRM